MFNFSHFCRFTKYLLKRPNISNGGLKGIPFIFGSATYRSCKPTCSSGGSGVHSVKYIPYLKKKYNDHDHKNMMLGRPMSPHLQIYGPTVPAMTSILQRGTGIGLSACAIFLAALALSSPKGIDSFVKYIQSWNLPEPIIIGLKTVIAFMFTFHFFTGLRFIFFNLGKGLDLKVAYQTAYAAIALSIASAVACGLIGHAY